jgi:DNA (cytosine-5)-methyltransferase 1
MDLKTTNTQKKEYVGNSNKSINIISMCSGIRGIERGLARALGHEPNTIIYVEIEAFIVANLIAGMEAGVLDPAPIWTDLKTFDGTPFCGKVHGIVAGWPCQPFSVAGKQKGVEDPRHLWPYIAKCIKATNPFFIFGENVPGHLNIGFREVKSELEEMGYRVEAGIYSAQEVGAPHKRDRLFILAIRFGVGLADPEMPKCKQSGNSWSRRNGSTNESIVGVDLVNSDNSGSGTSEYGINGNREKENEGWKEQSLNRISGSSEKLANPRLLRQEINEVKAAVVEQSCEGVAYSESIGMERNRTERQPIPEIQTGQEISGCDSRRDRWPARPGENQYDWEEPRTSGYINRLPKTLRSLWSASRKNFAKMLGEKIWEETDFRIQAEFERPLDTTINGYNFREDLLRAAGNAVVEQTAELAFIDLLNKIKKSKTRRNSLEI